MDSVMEINISHDFKKMTRDLHRLQKQAIPKAASRALNRTSEQVRIQAARSISKATGIKVSVVKKRLIKRKAGFNKLTAVVIAGKYAPNLIEFMTPGMIKRAMARKGTGVRSKAWKKTKEYRGSFVGRGKGSGKLLVFKRTGSSRKAKLKAMPGPSIPRTFVGQQIIKHLKSVASTRFKINFEADLNYYISKIR